MAPWNWRKSRKKRFVFARRRRARTKATRARSCSRSGWIQPVRTLASRAAFTTYASSRARTAGTSFGASGHAPIRGLKREISSLRSGTGRPSSPRVFAPLRVVRRGRVERLGPPGPRGSIVPVEILNGAALPRRIAPDLVEREEAAVSIEGGVFEPLGHHRPGELLPPSDKPQPLHLGRGREGAREVEEEDPLQERDGRPAEIAGAPVRLHDGGRDRSAVPRRHGGIANVGPIDREARGHLHEGPGEPLQGGGGAGP